MIGEISVGLIAALLVLAPQLIQALIQTKFGTGMGARLCARRF